VKERAILQDERLCEEEALKTCECDPCIFSKNSAEAAERLINLNPAVEGANLIERAYF